ncbi:unnamed protein product [Brassica napus]|uniref:(rape) hypothetical protein n=1 Tax=Brassica napus TaxID=3708 RepID=A0A816PR95_BRANA|nr:unnamed protein product [Brassica napus]
MDCRLSDDHQSLAVVSKQKGKESKRIVYNWDDAEIKSISEVNEANQVGICKVICTIEAIDTDWAWFYFGCNRHNKRVTKLPNVDYGRMTKIDKPLFRCEGCQNSITNVSPKFKLHLIVKDDTSTCKLMLLGSIAKSIIGVPAVDLWDGSYEEIEDPEILPSAIIALVGKSFCFGVSIGSDNVTNGALTFVVLDVFSGDKVLSIETESQKISETGTSSSTMSSGSHSSDDYPTPSTKRKEDWNPMTKRKKPIETNGDEPATKKTTTSFNDMLIPPVIQSFVNSNSYPDIPLSSIWFRLFENIENHQVPINSTSYQQISMLSPQTPRNIRRCVLGIIDTDEAQVFECSSQENTDNEDEDSDIDDPMDSESTIVLNVPTITPPMSLCPGGLTKFSISSKNNLKENEYLDEGDPDYKCSHCGAIMWYGERLNKRRNAKNPVFSLCCMQGQVQLPLLKEPPTVLKKLLEGDDPRSRHFQKHIRPYNMVFSFTSLGGKVVRALKKGIGPDMFQLQGENYHLLGNLTPPDGSEAKFGQLYIVDTENEVENRAKSISSGKQKFQVNKKDNLRKDIIEVLMKMLNEVNPYVQKFRSARDRFDTDPDDSFHMRIVSERRLFQQFVVDAFTTIESNRLRYLKLNQTSLRSDSYDSIKESENAGKVDMNEQGSEFTLPASFVGSPRYMKNNYLDAMTICKHFGFPDLFITFTCNPKWPEITRYVKARKLKAEDRSDIICRIFKIKLDSLMDALTKKNLLGETRSCKLKRIWIYILAFYLDNIFSIIDD